MSHTNEQFIAAQKSSVQAFATLSEKAFASFEKLIELNLAATKAIFSESMANLEALAGAKDVQAVLALQSGLVQPAADKVASYSRHLQEIVSSASADFSKVFESTSAQSQKSVTAFLESSLQSAPAGSEAAVAAIKSAMTAGTTAVESAQKAAKQAVKLVESNIATATSAGQKAE